MQLALIYPVVQSPRTSKSFEVCEVVLFLFLMLHYTFSLDSVIVNYQGYMYYITLPSTHRVHVYLKYEGGLSIAYQIGF